jgi:hypothetical protein
LSAQTCVQRDRLAIDKSVVALHGAGFFTISELFRITRDAASQRKFSPYSGKFADGSRMFALCGAA